MYKVTQKEWEAFALIECNSWKYILNNTIVRKQKSNRLRVCCVHIIMDDLQKMHAEILF